MVIPKHRLLRIWICQLVEHGNTSGWIGYKHDTVLMSFLVRLLMCDTMSQSPYIFLAIIGYPQVEIATGFLGRPSCFHLAIEIRETSPVSAIFEKYYVKNKNKKKRVKMICNFSRPWTTYTGGTIVSAVTTVRVRYILGIGVYDCTWVPVRKDLWECSTMVIDSSDDKAATYETSNMYSTVVGTVHVSTVYWWNL